MLSIALIFLIVAMFSTVCPGKDIAIIASGETHAMLDACDCSDTPAGGFAKRSSVISRIRKDKEVLLLDAGGFAGGGLYDFYTEGRARDSLRTMAAVEAMAAMGYDAAAIGDEELQYGAAWLRRQAQKYGLPLVSANCLDKKGEPVFAPYIFVKKGAVTFGITAVTTQERLFDVDTSVKVEEPVLALKKIWKKVKRGSDYQVIVSHVGEEYTSDLAEQFPDCTILVNGHRKKGLASTEALGSQYIMQFGFQGKYLSSIACDPDAGKFQLPDQQWVTVDDTVTDDAAVTRILEKYENSTLPVRTVLDLYLMSQCPYGIPALKEALAFSETVPLIELHVWFIGDVLEDGSLRSLHGSGEISDEKLWLAVRACYPELWYSFLYLCSAENMAGQKAVAAMKLDTLRLGKWITENADARLADHYIRSNRLDVEASPSLFVNNHLLQSEISFARLAKDYCGKFTGGKRHLLCDSLPECFEDADCSKPGKVGTCVRTQDRRGGVCSFSDAVTFSFTVVAPDNPLVPVEQQAVVTTRELFPGVQIEKHAMSSAEGKKLIRHLNQKTLPLFLFDKTVKQAKNFGTIEPGLLERGEWFTFKPGVMKPAFFINRKQKKRQLTLYIDPLFPDLGAVVKKIFATYPTQKNVTIKPIIYTDSITAGTSKEDTIRMKEALCWLVLGKYYDAGVLSQYLTHNNGHLSNTAWGSQLKAVGIDSVKFMKQFKKSSELVSVLYNELVVLDIRGPVELLFENREVLPVKNQHYLDELLEEIKKKYSN